MSEAAGIRVSFQPSGRTALVPPGTTVAEAAASAGVAIRAPCGGMGTCGKCLVRICSGLDGCDSPGDSPDAARRAEGWRLACRTRMLSDCVVEIPESSSGETSQRILAADAGAADAAPPRDPAVEVVDVAPPAPTRADARPDAMRISDAAGRPLRFPRATLAALPATARGSVWRLRLACSAAGEVAAVLPACAGDASRVLGVAFDLGTTTVVGTLMDLETGEPLRVESALNGQIPFGDDVLARILHAREHESGLGELRAAALATLNSIIDRLLAGAWRGGQIASVSVAGNTTMQHLLCGIDPSFLGELPFAPAFADALECTAGELGLDVNPAARVFVFPQVGGFVGGDTVACMLASDFDRIGGPTLLIDIGTNGEIALLAPDGGILCASTSAGPAFEGARIAQGMRAASGAIDKADVRAGALAIEVVGGAAPSGICGTALIDAAAVMLDQGIRDETGRILDPGELDPSLAEDLRGRVAGDGDDRRFVLSHASSGGVEVALFQRDIRELQLASGAIRAGVETLLSRAGISASDLDSILLAGAFGNFIRPGTAIRIGLLPPVEPDRVRFVGNAASLGAKMALLSRADRARASAIAARSRHVDLGTDPEFQTNFGMAMIFPDA